MVDLFPLISLILLMFIALSLTFFRNKFDMLSIFNIFYIGVYCFVPIHIHLLGSDFVHPNIRVAFEEYSMGTPTTILLIWMFWILLNVSYIKFNHGSVPVPKELKKTDIRPYLYVMAVFSMLFSFISLYFYSSQYGGFIRSVRLAAEIRAGRVPEGGPLVFFKQATIFMYISFLILFGYILENRRSIRLYMVFLISGIGSVMVMAIHAGRTMPIMLAVICYFTLAKHNNKLYFPVLLLIVSIGTILIAILNPLFNISSVGAQGFLQYLSTISSYDIYSTALRQLSHPYISIEVAVSNNSHANRLGIDWIYGVLHLLPTTLLGISLPDTVTSIHTTLITGEDRSYITPGLIAMFWYDLPWIGPAVGAIIYGYVGSFADKWLSIKNDPQMLAVYFAFTLLWSFYFVRAGDPRILFRGFITWIIVFGSVGVILSSQSYVSGKLKLTIGEEWNK